MNLTSEALHVLTTLLHLFTLYCASCLAAIFILSVLDVNDHHSFFEYFAAMRRGNALTDNEKEVIIKESAYDTSLDVIEEKNRTSY